MISINSSLIAQKRCLSEALADEVSAFLAGKPIAPKPTVIKVSTAIAATPKTKKPATQKPKAKKKRITPAAPIYMNREDALAHGSTYYQGTACKKCSHTLRYAKFNACVFCKRNQNMARGRQK